MWRSGRDYVYTEYAFIPYEFSVLYIGYIEKML